MTIVPTTTLSTATARSTSFLPRRVSRISSTAAKTLLFSLVAATGLLSSLLPSSVRAVNPGCFPSCQAEKPPMGWRSWNAVAADVNQSFVTAQVDGLVLRRNPAFGSQGQAVSLYDLGYESVAIDAGFQAGGTGVNGSFHDEAGHLLVNKTRFPDLKAFCEYANTKGVVCGLYENSDYACEYGLVGPYYTQDSQLLAEIGADVIKYDNCGPGRNLTLWAQAVNATGRSILIENCNDEFPFRPTVLPDGSLDCPYHFYRTGSDNSPTWLTIISNLMQLNDFLNISRPMCYAYGDMLEVGAPAPFIPTSCPGTPRLSFAEAQAHFAAWALLSSPLILGFDTSNTTEYDMWWPIVSNTEAIAINQAEWSGEAGHLIAASPQVYDGPVNAGCLCEAVRQNIVLPIWTVWGRSMPGGGATAAIALNTLDNVTAQFTITTEQLGFQAGATLNVRDLYAHQDLPQIVGQWNVTLGPRGSQFLMFTLPSVKEEFVWDVVEEARKIAGGSRRRSTRTGY